MALTIMVIQVSISIVRIHPHQYFHHTHLIILDPVRLVDLPDHLGPGAAYLAPEHKVLTQWTTSVGQKRVLEHGQHVAAD